MFVLGALVTALSPGLELLIAGRLFVGMAVALSAVSECLYIAEVSAPHSRGMLVSLNELGITVGFLFAYVIGLAYTGQPDGWR